MNYLRLKPALILAAILLPTGCGNTSPGVRIVPDGGADLRGEPDLPPPAPDLTVPPDLTPVVDMVQPACTLLGNWDVNGMGVVVTFSPNGTLLVMGMAFGTYMVQGDIFTVTDISSPQCGMPGTYTLTFSGDCGTVTAKLINDPCVERTNAIEGAWARR